ncbi:MAG: RNA polymerase sigma factor [Ignavibacteriae bacterium]|nr:RNA polymerase sigma factor [Ignavibacteriota bacterium]
MEKTFGKYSDLELYKALREKKPMAEAAFSELYSRYAQRVFAYCLRVMGNHDDAKDIFQETFMKFYNNAQSLEVVDNIPGLLLTIARNLCLNFKRDKKTTYNIDDYQVTSVETDYEKKELLELISMALELLEFEYREAFVLRQYQGLSYKEIAKLSGDSISAIKNRVWRAKEQIREILSPYLKEMSNK